jgi:selenocysteine lyase/cysteine desulfurase
VLNRRGFLHSMVGATAIAQPALRDDGLDRILSAADSVEGNSPAEVATDEDFWFAVQQAFTVDRSMINLNNGGVCPSPKVVQDAVVRYLEYSNQAPAYHMWRHLEPMVEGVRIRLARSFGCDPEEMAITRNASEALEICQFGIDLEPGDEILTTNQDYGRMLTTWDQRARRENIVINKFPFVTPPKSMQDLVDMFEERITPRTKVILFCHVVNLTGQIFPVKEISQMARSRGIETIVDGAHAFAHFPFTRDDLQCDYYGTSLHKWLLAPIGTGFLYVKRDKIEKLWPLMAAPESRNGDIRKFEEIGTHPAAMHNAIAEALTFHHGIGAERKIVRLRLLRDRWMRRLEGQPGVQLHTSFDPAMAGGLANVGIEGIPPGDLAEHLWDKHKIFVVGIGHPDCTGIRVTPNVYTTLDEVDRFAEAMEDVIRNGI